VTVKIYVLAICVKKPYSLESGSLLFEDPSSSIKCSRDSGRVRWFSGEYTIVSRNILQRISSKIVAEQSDAAACSKTFYGTRWFSKEIKPTLAVEHFMELDGSP
jgi:hypothetical protein